MVKEKISGNDEEPGTATTLIECHHIATSPQRLAVGFVWMKITNNIMITFRAFSDLDCRVVLKPVTGFVFIGLLILFLTDILTQLDCIVIIH